MGIAALKLLLVLVLTAWLCSACTVGGEGDGDVSGPEFVWKLHDPPEPTYEALGIVGSGDRGFVIVANRRTEAEPYHDWRTEQEVVLVKADRWGNQVWEKTIGDDSVMETFGVMTEIDGGVVMAGTCRDDNPDELCLIRIDSEGNTVWHNTYEWRWRAASSNHFGRPSGVLQTGDGGFVVVGTTGGDGWYLLKTDGDGGLLWNHTYGWDDAHGMRLRRGEENNPSRIVASRDGGFIAVGWTYLSESYESIVNIVKVDGYGEVVWKNEYGQDTSESYGTVVLRGSDGYVVSGNGYTFMVNDEGSTVWQKPFGGSLMVRSSAGGFVVVGRHESYRPAYGIYRVDEDGDKVWESTYEDWHAEEATQSVMYWGEPFAGIGETDDYGFVLAGDVLGDLRVKKIDSEGEEVWDKLYGRGVMIHDIAASPDGDFVVAGTTQVFGAGMRDAYVSGIDGQDGYRVWERSYGGPGWDSLECITVSGDGGYVAAGYTTSLGKGGRDVYIIRVDGEGNKVWEDAYGTSLHDNAVDIARCDDGGFVVAGNTESYDGQTKYGYLLKVDAWGRKVWDRNYESEGYDQLVNIVPTRDGGLMVVKTLGYSQAPIWLLRISANGHTVWERTYPGGFTDPYLTGTGDRFLVTDHGEPTFLVDGDGNKMWERNCTEEFAMVIEDWTKPTYRDGDVSGGLTGSFVIPGSLAIGVCDGGFMLIHTVLHGSRWAMIGCDAVLWRVDEEGDMVWATELTDLSNGTAWWLKWVSPDDGRQLRKGPYVANIVQGENGVFALAGNILSEGWGEPLLRPEPFILKIRDPSLVGVECPEPYILTAILLTPLYLVWRMRRTRTHE